MYNRLIIPRIEIRGYHVGRGLRLSFRFMDVRVLVVGYQFLPSTLPFISTCVVRKPYLSRM